MNYKRILITVLILFSSFVINACAQKPIVEKNASNQVYKIAPANISAAFPYKSHYIKIRGSRIHYIDKGKKSPIVFIHGNPTSSYLWRNVIPYVTKKNRAIAIDLIGMGKSDKPMITYTFNEHYQYVEEFIKRLKLNNITLVLHDWGAAIGFEYARRNPKNVKAIAFMEGVLPPAFPKPSFEAMGKEMGDLFKTLKDPIKGKQMIIYNNGFVEQLLPAFTNRTLTHAEMTVYRAPFKQKSSRKPTLIWPLQIPIAGKPVETTATMNKIESFMLHTEIPVLLFYASPGAIVSSKTVNWYENKIKNLETVYIGQGFHYLPEDQPEAIGRALHDWLRRLHK